MRFHKIGEFFYRQVKTGDGQVQFIAFGMHGALGKSEKIVTGIDCRRILQYRFRLSETISVDEFEGIIDAILKLRIHRYDKIFSSGFFEFFPLKILRRGKMAASCTFFFGADGGATSGTDIRKVMNFA